MLAYVWMLIFAESLVGVKSLLCYKTDEDGSVVQVDSPEFSYCVFFPKHLDKNGRIVKNYVDGVRANEADPLYDNFFDQNDKFYTALAVCIHEKINWPVLWKSSWPSGRGGKSPRAEYVLRCMCKSDLCNNPTDVEENFNAIRGPAVHTIA